MRLLQAARGGSFPGRKEAKKGRQRRTLRACPPVKESCEPDICRCRRYPVIDPLNTLRENTPWTPSRPYKFGFRHGDRHIDKIFDVDFEHERREEVIQYIFERFGRDRAAILPTVTVLHYKGAMRDVARAMGLSVDTTNKLSDAFGEFNEEDLDHILERTLAYLKTPGERRDCHQCCVR
ncbi:MAG: hypothetical protein ACTHJ8_03400 [Mucilaginibacter sp.]